MNEYWLKMLYDANYEMLYRIASNRLTLGMGHDSDVQDVLQEVFVAASKQDIHNHPNPVGWLVVTTTKICNNYIGKNARHHQKVMRYAQATMDKSAHNAALFVERGEDDTAVSDIRLSMEQSLTQDEYSLLTRYCEREDSLDKMADEMDISPSALRVRIFRIRKKLKKFFDRE